MDDDELETGCDCGGCDVIPSQPLRLSALVGLSLSAFGAWAQSMGQEFLSAANYAIDRDAFRSEAAAAIESMTGEA